MQRINVTKTFLPPLKDYQAFVEEIWENNQLTNQGPLLQRLESEVKKYLDLNDFHFVTNGTVALQLALNALDITEGEIITTPFSYVATTSAILWERCTPVFVDIKASDYCIDPQKIESAITPATKAILAVHVFGNPCDIDVIAKIAKTHNLKVIYDAAHAFGATYKNKSLLNYGDVSTSSFHSTKLFHTIEGGCLIAADRTVSDNIDLKKRFGHTGDNHYMLGINAKSSEFQAAMGLANLPHVKAIIADRKRASETYDRHLGTRFGRPEPLLDAVYNYAYYPIVFESEAAMLTAFERLASINAYPRRYFYPSLNMLPYIATQTTCPISEDIASRIACLPLYYGLEDDSINQICEVLCV